VSACGGPGKRKRPKGKAAVLAAAGWEGEIVAGWAGEIGELRGTRCSVNATGLMSSVKRTPWRYAS